MEAIILYRKADNMLWVQKLISPMPDNIYWKLEDISLHDKSTSFMVKNETLDLNFRGMTWEFITEAQYNRIRKLALLKLSIQ